MAKFYGIIGFSVTTDNGTGVWKNEIVEKKYCGDLLQCKRNISSGEGVNDNIFFSNKISVLVDSFAINNFPSILYVEFMGTKWKVTSVEAEFPRLILTTGGVYNG